MNTLPIGALGETPEEYAQASYENGYRKGFMDGQKEGFAKGLQEGKAIMLEISRTHQLKPEKKPRKARNMVAGPYTPQFERFWALYPTDMRGTKLEAWMEFAKLAPNELLIDEMCEALKKQVAAYEAHAAGKGPFFARLKHACRWIKYQGWDMDVPEPAAAKKGGPNRPELG